ncbi:MAG: GNAT family N-acetyltransferase [Lewinellaceae bacterium]|nr:GNAT family N-acetyltransferase [Lewinellaceae bacterium]
MHLLRTTSEHPDFKPLVAQLDAYLTEVDGEDHAFYDQYNKIDALQHVVVAYHQEAPVGCGAIKPFQEGTAEVKRMYVHPEQRGHGIARQILAALETWASELGYSSCILETGIKQTAAVSLYLNSGYIRIPNYGPYAGVENSLCFEKKLVP